MNRLLSLPLLLLALTACVSGPGQPLTESQSHAEKLLTTGVDAYNRQNYESAYKHFDQALYEYRLLDDPTGIISSSINIARTHHATGQQRIAKTWIDKARQLNEAYRPESHLTLSQHIDLLDARVDVATEANDAAKTILRKIIDNKNTDKAIALSAVQLRTRIAFSENIERDRWLKRYRETISNSGDTFPVHQARLARFSAQLETDTRKQNQLYATALNKYRRLSNKSGIAATLTEWAQRDSSNRQTALAEDKWLRALLIRLAQHDASDSQAILKNLQALYQQTHSSKADRARYWYDKLDDADFNLWRSVMQDFDRYPAR